MKRPLKPSEVPPGSQFRRSMWHKDESALVIHTVPSGFYVAMNGQTNMEKFNELCEECESNNIPLIKRPGEDWQPCCVDEFCPSDYKPGQEVDVATARKLHEAGVKLEVQDRTSRPNWSQSADAVFRNYTDNELSVWEAKFRLAPAAPKLRDIRPDELPFIFQIEYKDGTKQAFSRCSTTPEMIAVWVEKSKGYRVHENGHVHSFQVEDE